MTSTALYEEMVDALNAIHGAHAGRRAVHTNGVLLAGSFTATPEAARLSRAAHLRGEPVRITARFSNGGGDPAAPDGKPDGRGLAVKFYLPDGSTTDIVALTLPVFFVRTPEDFLEFTRARRPDPETGKPDMEKLGAFVEAHPEALPAIQIGLAMKAPDSYACQRYWAIHAFRLVNSDGESRAVRYRLEPEAGIAEIESDEAKGRAPDYLRAGILEQLPAAFTLHAQLAEDGDPEDDPTAAWPDERETVELGRLELTGPETGRETGDDVLVFDPTRVTDGIELSGDRVLAARSHAYAVSVERRSGVRREA
ncbi:MAG TPA: catalase family peroxidase [Thermoleophilaceae bacterium]|nr:catalase family peroxidase [Thermoleophilaceae bacterium]